MKYCGRVTASGTAGGQGWLLWYTPDVCGRTPVMSAARDGLHAGAGQWARVKSMPRFARRSMFGVFACGCPPRQPTQSLRSSTAMKRTLGREPPVAAGSAAEAEIGNSTSDKTRATRRMDLEWVIEVPPVCRQTAQPGGTCDSTGGEADKRTSALRVAWASTLARVLAPSDARARVLAHATRSRSGRIRTTYLCTI